MGGDESHTAQYLDSGVGHNTEKSRSNPVFITGVFSEIRIQRIEGDSGSYRNDDLFVVIEHSFYLVDDLFHPPGLYCYDDDVCSLYSFYVVE